MSKADKMFKKAGYDRPLELSHLETGVEVIHTLYMKYTQEAIRQIKFYPEDRTIIAEYHIRQNNGSWGETNYIPLSMAELKAINTKVKELGWEE